MSCFSRKGEVSFHYIIIESAEQGLENIRVLLRTISVAKIASIASAMLPSPIESEIISLVETSE